MARTKGKAAPEDLWQTESGDNYDPNEFYTAASDKRGHSEVMYVKLPPYLVSALAQFVQKERIPQYKTVQDFVRDAVVHRLHYIIHNWPGELDEYGTMLRVHHRISRLKEKEETFQAILDDLAKLSLGNQDQKAIALEQYRELLDTTEVPGLRQRVLAMAKQYFPDQPWPTT